MRLLIILCFTNLFLCTQCGLIKNIIGAVSDGVHKIKDGNVVKNVVHIVHNETKGIIEDLGDLLHIKKNQNNNEIKPTENDKDKKIEDVPNSTVKPVTVQVSTAQIDEEKHIQPDSNGPDSKIPATEETDNEIPNSTNQADDSIQTSSESSNSNKLIFKDEEYDYGEGKIEPRKSRHITDDNQTNQDTAIEQTTEKDDKNSSHGEEIIYANTNVNELFFNNDDFDRLILFFPDGDASTEPNEDCPEGLQKLLNGTCVEPYTIAPQVRKKIKNKADFVGGCLSGFGQADDGTCQEVIYD